MDLELISFCSRQAYLKQIKAALHYDTNDNLHASRDSRNIPGERASYLLLASAL